MRNNSLLSSTEIVDRLNELRKVKGMTLEQLSDRSVISRPHLSKIFAHKIEPNLSTTLRIAAALEAKMYFYC